MKTFEIVTLGCKVNQCESQLLREQLSAIGLREALVILAAFVVFVALPILTYLRRRRMANVDARMQIGQTESRDH